MSPSRFVRRRGARSRFQKQLPSPSLSNPPPLPSLPGFPRASPEAQLASYLRSKCYRELSSIKCRRLALLRRPLLSFVFKPGGPFEVDALWRLSRDLSYKSFLVAEERPGQSLFLLMCTCEGHLWSFNETRTGKVLGGKFIARRHEKELSTRKS